MSIAMITDTHFGVKNDAEEFIIHQEKFYTEFFFPELVKRGIKTLWHLGDIFDRRKYTNHVTLARFRACFFDKLREHDITMYLIVGNHDTYYKSTNDVNAPSLFLEGYEDCVVIIEEPTILEFDDTPVMFMPWVNSENYKTATEMMVGSVPDICVGHFEIRGFEMNRGGGVNTSGFRAEMFDQFSTVFSGHFHEPSTDGRITYLGAPYQYTWADFECDRGFYIFEPSTLKLGYRVNPDNMFYRIMYDETGAPWSDHDFSQYEGKIIRLIVADNVDTEKFESFVEKIEHANPYNFEVIDNTSYHIASDDVDDDALKNEDTMGIVSSYIEQSEIDIDKEKLNDIFKNLYVEALSLEK